MTAPGWYTDPYDPSQMRWWDGTAWGEQTSPGAQPVAPEPAPAWGVPRSATAPSQYYELPESPVQPTRERRLGVLLLAVLVLGVAVIAVVVTRSDGDASSPSTTTTADAMPSIGDVYAGAESCQIERKTLLTALEAWYAVGGSSIPAENGPSGYPAAVELLFSTQDPQVQFLAEPVSSADWVYDPAVGAPSLHASPTGRFADVALICNAS